MCQALTESSVLFTTAPAGRSYCPYFTDGAGGEILKLKEDMGLAKFPQGVRDRTRI